MHRSTEVTIKREELDELIKEHVKKHFPHEHVSHITYSGYDGDVSMVCVQLTSVPVEAKK